MIDFQNVINDNTPNLERHYDMLYDVVNTVFWKDKIPKEGMHYICIAVINIDSAMKIEKTELSSSVSRRMQI